MTRALWIDAQLSPSLAPWIEETFGIPAFFVSRLGLRDAHTSRSSPPHARPTQS